MSTPDQPQPNPAQQPQQPQYSAAQQPQAQQPPPAAPQAQQPQYAAPQAQQPQYAQPQYGAPQQVNPSYSAAGYAGDPGPGEPFDGAQTADDLKRPLYGAGFGQAVRRFFKNYANFTGRASRSEYWWVALFAFLLQLIPGILVMIGMSASAATMYATSSIDATTDELVVSDAGAAGGGFAAFALIVGWILSVVIALGIIVPSLAITWRRLHDGNFAGPFYFLSFIPGVGGLILLVLMLLPSKPEGRRFDTAR